MWNFSWHKQKERIEYKKYQKKKLAGDLIKLIKNVGKHLQGWLQTWSKIFCRKSSLAGFN
jgi:hypothetical protein